MPTTSGCAHIGLREVFLPKDIHKKLVAEFGDMRRWRFFDPIFVVDFARKIDRHDMHLGIQKLFGGKIAAIDSIDKDRLLRADGAPIAILSSHLKYANGSVWLSPGPARWQAINHLRVFGRRIPAICEGECPQYSPSLLREIKDGHVSLAFRFSDPFVSCSETNSFKMFLNVRCPIISDLWTASSGVEKISANACDALPTETAVTPTSIAGKFQGVGSIAQSPLRLCCVDVDRGLRECLLDVPIFFDCWPLPHPSLRHWIGSDRAGRGAWVDWRRDVGIER